MRILLTNDDGINSPGIRAMESALSACHEVIVVAPSGERSGFSNSLTFHGNVKIKKIAFTGHCTELLTAFILILLFQE